MWWIIGGVSLVLVVYLLAKIRESSRHSQLVNAAINHINVSLQMLDIVDRENDARYWRDPYFLGFVQGSLAWLIKIYGGNMNVTKKGLIVVDAIKFFVGEDYKRACGDIAELNASRDESFDRGASDGTNVMLLSANRGGPELLADPDVKSALLEAPSWSDAADGVFGPRDRGEQEVAAGVLSRIYMKRLRAQYP